MARKRAMNAAIVGVYSALAAIRRLKREKPAVR